MDALAVKGIEVTSHYEPLPYHPRARSTEGSGTKLEVLNE